MEPSQTKLHLKLEGRIEQKVVTTNKKETGSLIRWQRAKRRRR
jgi:hypothetical protein